MNSVFSEQILADKLSKLSTTQLCIETLSHWCIFHQSKAEVIVATWNKLFHSSEMTQKVPLLYLANDILQNSRRKGNEFVVEFWKVLPGALKDFHTRADDQDKKVVSRLVHIWEDRKVFGSKAQNLKDIMLADEVPPALDFSKKRSRTVKIVRRDSRSIRMKLSIGGPEEKIVSAFHLVLNEHLTEVSEMNRCKSAVDRIRKMDQDVEIACAQAKDPKRKLLAKELEEEEQIVKECIEKLKSVETNRAALVSHLREALLEQESELENIRTQMQAAQAQAQEVNSMRKRLNNENCVATSYANSAKSIKTAADIAAEVADKLTASSSSQMIMTSVLSTFAAEQAKKNAATTNTVVSSSYPQSVSSAPIPMPKLEQQPASVSLHPASVAAPAHQYQPMLVNAQNVQSMSPNPHAQYQLLPHTSQQYPQTPIGVTSFGACGGLPIPPPPPPTPPPPPPHVIPMMPLAQPPLQINQQLMPMTQLSGPLPQQHSMPLFMKPHQGPPDFRPLQPPGTVYFTQCHQLQ